MQTAAKLVLPIHGKLFSISNGQSPQALVEYDDKRFFTNESAYPKCFDQKFYFFANPDSVGQELFVSD